MCWLLVSEAHLFPRIPKIKAIIERLNPEKPATNTVNVAEDINNQNDESSKNDIEVIFDGTLDKEAMVPDK